MKELEALCRESAESAVNLLRTIMADPDQPAPARLQAARELLDRGFGKPIDRQAVLQMNGGTNGTEVEALTEAQLLRIANGALEYANHSSGDRGQVIDLRVVSRDEEGEGPPD